MRRLGRLGDPLTLESDNRLGEEAEPMVVDLRVIPEPLIGRVIWAWVDLR